MTDNLRVTKTRGVVAGGHARPRHHRPLVQAADVLAKTVEQMLSLGYVPPIWSGMLSCLVMDYKVKRRKLRG